MKQPAPLKFTPRVLPRNITDWGLGVLAMLMTLLAMGLVYGCFFLITYLLAGNEAATGLLFRLNQFILVGALAYSVVVPVLRLELTEEGIRIVRPFQTVTVAWDEIESVEEVSPAQCGRLMLHKDLFTGRRTFPWTLTFSGCVFVRHKSGSILFPPKNKEIFLHELRKYQERKRAEQNQGTSTTNPWHWTTQTLREENQQTLKSRSQD